MSEEKKMDLLEVTLSTGKIIHIRQLQVGDQELAVEAVGNRLTEKTPPMIASMWIQKELLKLLIVAVGRKELTGLQKENISTVFDSFVEQSELLEVVKEMMGNPTKPEVKIVSSIGSN